MIEELQIDKTQNSLQRVCFSFNLFLLLRLTTQSYQTLTKQLESSSLLLRPFC